MDLFNNLLSNSIINALGWTILHSIWQIALVAIIFGILSILIKRYSASLKYFMATVAMLAILILSILTLLNEFENFKKQDAISQSESGITIINIDENPAINNYTLLKVSFYDKVKVLINNNLKLIVGIWNFCVLFLLIKLLGGLFYSQRLRYFRTNILQDSWNRKVVELAEVMGIKKKILLLKSLMVKTPMVIGFLKPVILLPVGFITGLSASQLEAILMHELAHIKRNDYLVNIFISMVEILFFFHPAVWWISNRIKTERENACDDIAISKKINSVELAKALANIELLNLKIEKYSIAFNGNKGSLIKRIRRMTTHHSTKFTFKEGLISTGIVLLCLIVMAFSSNSLINAEKLAKSKPSLLTSSKINEKDKNRQASEIQNSNDLVNPVNLSDSEGLESPKAFRDTIVTINQDKEIIYKVDGIHYKLIFDENHELVQFFVEETEMPKDKWSNYQKTINEALVYQIEPTDRNKDEFEKQKIFNELVEDMKNVGLIDMDAISYKVHFYDNYLVINDERQSNEVFEKYKKMFDEKSKGKFKLDVQLNVNPNFYKKSPKEIHKIQKEALAMQENEIKLMDKELRMRAEDLKRKELELQLLEIETFKKEQESLKDKENKDLQLKEEQLKNKEGEFLRIQEEQLRERENELRNRENELRIRENELRKREDELRKHKEEIRKHDLEIKQKDEEIRKQIEEIEKEKKETK